MPIYSSEPAILRPKHFFMQFILGLSRSGTLAYYLFLRDLKSRYRQSFFSYLWILIPPVATSLTFIFLESSQLFQVGDTLIPYPLYVLSGALAWQLFVDSLNLPLRVISSNRKMLVKINFPRESLVLAGLSQVFFNFAIRILVFLPVFIYYGITPSGILVFLPLVIMALVLFGLALGLLLTPLGLLYQDIEMSLLLMTSVWFFITPVAYPKITDGIAGVLNEYNPVSSLVISFRECFYQIQFTEIFPLLLVGGISAFVAIFSWFLFQVAMPHIIARIGS